MHNHILTKGQIIDEQYTVAFFLKKGSYAESYRVTNTKGETKLLKLFDFNKLHKTQYTADGDVLEIEILRNVNHPNISTRHPWYFKSLHTGWTFIYFYLYFIVI